MAIIDEDFYRCTCGSSRFKDVSEHVVRIDPDFLHSEDYNNVPPAFKKIIPKFECSECGLKLKRGVKKYGK